MSHKFKITAELRQWSLNDERCFIRGFVHNSTDQQYGEGDEFYILNFKHMAYYPAYKTDVTKTDDHWIVETQLGKYFLLYKAHMK